MTSELTRYDAAVRALAEAKEVDEVLHIRDLAEATRAAARIAKNKQLEVDAAAIRFSAERTLGKLMEQQRAADALSKGGRPSAKTGSQTNPVSAPPTLAELGIKKPLADRARKLAAMPESDFEATVTDFRFQMFKDSERVVLNLLKSGERTQNNAATRANTPPLPVGKYAVIYADPPWPFETRSENGKGRSAENHYPTMTLADIEALPVGNLAADDCVLFLWTTMPQLPAALRVIEAWGFIYKTAGFNWIKTTRSGALATGMGYWTRSNAELCLLATRGSPPRLSAEVHQVVMAPPGGHSEKPDEVRERIERLIAGPYVELFARTARPGWTAWGNQLRTVTDPPSPDRSRPLIDNRLVAPEPDPLAVPEFLRRPLPQESRT